MNRSTTSRSSRSYPFEQADDAHRYLAERRNIGKVVLIPHQNVRSISWNAVGSGAFLWRVLGVLAILDIFSVVLQPVFRSRERMA